VLALRGGSVAALLCVLCWTPSAHAAPAYDDGTGTGCVACHIGFQGGTGALHTQHRNMFGVTTCNLCHPSGGGSTPVLTYSSGSGGGLGCAGCHGQDYGETSPNSGQPKATAYGLRQFHVNQGITSCGTSGCHQPGALGHPNPFPPLFGEDEPPPYFDPAFSDLADPCASSEEDIPFDLDSVGLDNDGDGVADFPADADCSEPVTTTTTSSTTTTTLPFFCGSAPAAGCIAPGKGSLLVNEKAAGKEKLKSLLTKLQIAVAPSQFGDPVGGTTRYKVCIYDAANQLRGEYGVARAGDTCGDRPCWSALADKGYQYSDKSTTADGILKITLIAGDAGKGKVVVIGKNNASALPTGVAAALQDETSATVQLLTSDASCFGTVLTQVKKADGLVFSAAGP
jgi:hypothetical protein